MQTITNEVAFSGRKSSQTGSGNDFSMTLEYPLKTIPDSIKRNITVEFMLYQTSLNHNAQLILEANGTEFSYYLNQYNLKQEAKEENKWIKYSRVITIPDSIKQADLIKIYVYNPSKEKIYIDDFNIKIKE